MREEDIRKNLATHVTHVYLDFLASIEKLEFDSMDEVWEKYITFQVEAFEKYKAKKQTPVG